MERKIACPKCSAENLAWRSRCEACGEKLHGDEPAMPAFQGRGAGFWVALGLGVVGAGIFAFVAVATPIIAYGYRLFPYAALGPLPGLAVCWKWPRAAAIELIVVSLLPLRAAFQPPPVNVSGLTVYLLLMTAPLLSSGILFYRAGQHMQNDRAK